MLFPAIGSENRRFWSAAHDAAKVTKDKLRAAKGVACRANVKQTVKFRKRCQVLAMKAIRNNICKTEEKMYFSHYQSTMKTSKRRRRKTTMLVSHLKPPPLIGTPIDVNTKCRHLFLHLALVLAILQTTQALGANQLQSQESNRDELALIEPEFAPTRKPAVQNQAVTSSSTTTVASHRQSQQQQVTASATNARQSSTKFAKINELDSFLDDMNHNELREIVSGKPIDGELFKPKPLSGREEQKTSSNRPQEVPLLETSHSEQQVYTECALILQRTYVKNIDDPRHQLVPFGKTEQSCISYKHIDKALALAKQQLKFKELKKRERKKMKKNFDIIHATLEPPEELVAALGELNMATTQIIADQFDLSNDELLNGLPLIDMSKTKFWPLCPMLVRQDLECRLARFRSHTGHCNNLKHPTWGAAMTPFARYLPPIHPDGIWTPRKSVITEVTFQVSPGHRELHAQVSPSQRAPVFHHQNHHRHLEFARSASSVHTHYEESSQPNEAASVQFVSHAQPPEATTSSAYLSSGAAHKDKDKDMSRAASSIDDHHHNHRSASSVATELPSARLVTSIVHRDMDLPSHDFSILFMSWGQLLDHDMTRAAQPPSSIKCCPGEDSEGDSNKLCLPIQVPPNDPFYSKFGVNCLEFRRSLAGLRPNCVLGPRVHQNAITAPIDANFVYGSSQAQADALREFKGGRLRNRDWFQRQRLKPLLPAQEEDPDQDCLGRPEGLFCFLAGDVRVNEQTHLTVLHTLYMREHNRIAQQLEHLNAHWDDERIYQETRHIMAAGVQHVMLNEYLPLLIGRKMGELYNLTAHGGDHLYWPGYDPTVTTSVANSFAAAAFRQGHTFVQGTVERYNKYHEFVASERLRRLLKQPFLIYQPGVLDELALGMLNQPAQGYDPFVSEDISGHLFQPPQQHFGHDLPAINLQRGREQGLPGYNLFREWCGLPRAETFAQLEPYLSNHTAYHYARLYKHVDDIDLWSGGVSERRLPGAAIGPTFACIIARQFSNTRRGDRFWYENPGLPSSFTPKQLQQIKGISLARILCTNSDDLPTIQRWALRMAHPVLNPRVACHQLPQLDLRHWQEHRGEPS